MDLNGKAPVVTGQTIWIGGDRLNLWNHPTEAVAANAAGGWRADDIAEVWLAVLATHEQSVGETLPELARGNA